MFQLSATEQTVSELESSKGRMSVETTSQNNLIEELEHKLGLLQKNNKSLEAQLADLRSQLEDEMRSKSDALHKLQHANAEMEQLQDSLDEEQNARSDLQNKFSKAANEASQWRGKYETEGANRVEELEDAK